MKLALLYRGPLRSCNLSCGYCPLDTAPHTPAELEADRVALERLIAWVRDHTALELSLLFTPWGESLIHPHVQQGLAELSRLPQVERVAIQTNLSCALDWIDAADSRSLALWVSFHPQGMAVDALLARTARLDAAGIRHSVGLVGLREHLGMARQLRARLPEDTYLWINAYKDGGADYYSPAEVEACIAVDPLFGHSLHAHASLGEACRTGAQVLSLAGDGSVTRCHFVADGLGNLYTDPLESLLAERPCSQQSCGCHIGYVHLDRLGLGEIFGPGLLERIPEPAALAAARPRPAPAPIANPGGNGYSAQAPTADHLPAEDLA